MESLKQLDKAAEAYQKIITANATQTVATQAKLALASVHEQKGQAAQALKIYEDVGADRPNTAPSLWAREANVRKERLLATHPELVVAAPAPAPVPVMAPAGALPVKK